MTDEKQSDEGKKKGQPDANLETRNESKANEEIERINAETERLNKSIAENENARARAKLAGISTFSAPDKPKEDSPKEYARKVLAGEFNDKVEDTPE